MNVAMKEDKGFALVRLLVRLKVRPRMAQLERTRRNAHSERRQQYASLVSLAGPG